ncbi:MAG: sensor histidine kinase [Planctomycetes bacterium]|nr:sensor histidine kinase [Planctomycetota bacterium]
MAEALSRLESDSGTVPWTDRRSIAASLRDELTKSDKRTTVIRLACALADDPKWEVRKEIASLLPSLPDDEFAPLAAKLTEDSNGFVRKAAQRALDLRRKGSSDAGDRRKGLDQVAAQFDTLGATHGKVVSAKAQALAWRLYEVSVAATVHDLRGVLTSACSNLAKLKADASKPSFGGTALREALEKVAERLAYLEKFVNAMGAYAQSIPHERAATRVEKIVRDAHSVAVDAVASAYPEAKLANGSIAINDVATVVVAQHEIVVALANVIKNAYEAVLAGNADPRTGRVNLSAECICEGEVRVVIQDNGMGINAEDLRELRAFVPGRTTKKGSGTGFGLPIAQRYVAAHGGSISIDSVENAGTTVTIVLPTELQQGSENDAESTSR